MQGAQVVWAEAIQFVIGHQLNRLNCQHCCRSMESLLLGSTGSQLCSIESLEVMKRRVFFSHNTTFQWYAFEDRKKACALLYPSKWEAYPCSLEACLGMAINENKEQFLLFVEDFTA